METKGVTTDAKLLQIAEDTRLLTTLMGVSIEEAWENHTDQSIKDAYSLDEIKAVLAG